MAITKSTVDAFVEVLEAVRTGTNHFEVPEKPGIACAKGTLTARTNAVRLIAAQLETRDPTPADEQAFIMTLNTLKWLATDSYAVKDFVDVDLPIPATPLANERPDLVQSGAMTYEPAMTMLIKTLETTILSVG